MAIGNILSGSNLVDQTMAAMLAAGTVSVLNSGTHATAILPRFSMMTVLAGWQQLRGAAAHVEFWSLLLVPATMLLTLMVRHVTSLKANELLLPMAVLASVFAALSALIFLSFSLFSRVKTGAMGAY